MNNSSQVMADMKKVYDDLIIINLYLWIDNDQATVKSQQMQNWNW